MTTVPRISMAALGVASLLVTALPASAQPVDPNAPPPTNNPPPVAASSMPAPMAPMAVAKSPDDMTGSVGFGVGLISNAELFGTDSNVAIKYWMSNTLALVPAFTFAYSKTDGVDATWVLGPEALVLFTPFVASSTRLQVGGGLGFAVGQRGHETAFQINIPIQAGVEHFFMRWFSMGIAVRSNLFEYIDPGRRRLDDERSMIDTRTSLLGSLFFYTD